MGLEDPKTPVQANDEPDFDEGLQVQILMEELDELKRSNTELEQYARVIAHDLKEPLRGAKLYAQVLGAQCKDDLGEGGRKKLDALSRLLDKLTGLVDTLLVGATVRKADSDAFSVDLNEVMADVRVRLETRFQESGTELRVPRSLPTVVCGDSRVAEIFANLVSNALKYNDKAERYVEIGWTDTETEPQSGRSVEGPVFYVRDNGIGIAQDDIGRIFHMYERLHEEDAYGGGHGAGLAIVERIIDHVGGRLWVESEPGEGTCFRFTLRAAKPR